MKRDYEINEMNEINENPKFFVYFVHFVYFIISLHSHKHKILVHLAIFVRSTGIEG